MNSITVSFDRINCNIIKNHRFLHQIMANVRHTWLGNKILITKLINMANNILMQFSFVNVYLARNINCIIISIII